MAEGVDSISTRATAREEFGARSSPVFTPSRFLLSQHQRSLRDKNITIAVLFAGLLIVWFCLHAASADPKIMVIDPAGTIIQGPVESLALSKGFFAITSINAAQAALQRSTIGCDLQDLLPLYFSAKARHTIEDDVSARAADVRRRKLSTKPLIDSITPPDIAGDKRVVKVAGRLQTSGAVNGHAFIDEPPFELVLVFRVNADLANKAAMPWIVDEIDLALGNAEVSSHRAKNRPRS
ncbi:MAG TPA: hypothetical protein VIM69_06995 [Opitutaceae bacterium]